MTGFSSTQYPSPMGHTYIASEGGAAERERLERLEQALDPSTRRYLRHLGIGAGMRCLEVGAGTGSIAAWMATAVGTSGCVVATDLDIRPLEWLTRSHSNLTVREEDVGAGVARDHDGMLFDFAHARLVIGHVADPRRALRHILSVLRPGGWCLIEDTDFLWTEVGEQPIHPIRHVKPYMRVWHTIVRDMRERGFDVSWGRGLAHALRELGLEQVAGEAVMLIGNAHLTEAMRRTIERFGNALVEEERLTAQELRECLDALSDPETLFTGSPMFSVWGRRPNA